MPDHKHLFFLTIFSEGTHVNRDVYPSIKTKITTYLEVYCPDCGEIWHNDIKIWRKGPLSKKERKRLEDVGSDNFKDFKIIDLVSYKNLCEIRRNELRCFHTSKVMESEDQSPIPYPLWKWQEKDLEKFQCAYCGYKYDSPTLFAQSKFCMNCSASLEQKVWCSLIPNNVILTKIGEYIFRRDKRAHNTVLILPIIDLLTIIGVIYLFYKYVSVSLLSQAVGGFVGFLLGIVVWLIISAILDYPELVPKKYFLFKKILV